jgi:hypothetical protein
MVQREERDVNGPDPVPRASHILLLTFHRPVVDISPVRGENPGPEGARRAPVTQSERGEAQTMSTSSSGEQSAPAGKPRVMILGGGPNRIGQGIEFDYCCCHASYAVREVGCESVMVNCNPETVSTDYDTSDRLYFEPLTVEDVLAIAAIEKPLGAIVQLGGQTPLNLAVALEERGLKILGTSPDAIARASDRERFKRLLEKLGLRQPENGTAFTFEEARAVAHRVGYPVVVRPSFVLGGRAMEIVFDDSQLEHFVGLAKEASTAPGKHPILIDKFSTSTRSPTAGGASSARSWSTSRRPASTPATPAAPSRPTPWASACRTRSATRSGGSPRSWAWSAS